jgi:LysR family transcriptional regulator, low CO2-responsive transcriptional regulator
MDTATSAELRAFDATVRSGSMSAAARQLGLRQPTVSAHIASLEAQFGSALFIRRGRRLDITEMGPRLYDITNRIHHAEDEAARLLAGVRSQYEGTLRVSAIGPYNVTPILASFRAQHPRIAISVSICDSRSVVARVMDHQTDIGVMLYRVDDPNVFCMPYRQQPLVVFAATTHPFANRSSISLRDLHQQDFVLREQGSQTRRVFEEGLQASGFSVRTAVEMGSREAVHEAVAQGLGLGVVATPAFRKDPRVVVLHIPQMTLATHVHLICRHERLHETLLSRFIATATTLRDELDVTTSR